MRTRVDRLLVFQGVQNTKFCSQPPGIGFTVARTTSNDPRACNWHGPCCVMAVRIDDNHLLQETYMNTLSSKLTALAAALLMNGLIMGAVGYLFEIQSHPPYVSDLFR
jgi:hypothetical protein